MHDTIRYTLSLQTRHVISSQFRCNCFSPVVCFFFIVGCCLGYNSLSLVCFSFLTLIIIMCLIWCKCSFLFTCLKLRRDVMRLYATYYIHKHNGYFSLMIFYWSFGHFAIAKHSQHLRNEHNKMFQEEIKPRQQNTGVKNTNKNELVIFINNITSARCRPFT